MVQSDLFHLCVCVCTLYFVDVNLTPLSILSDHFVTKTGQAIIILSSRYFYKFIILNILIIALRI